MKEIYTQSLSFARNDYRSDQLYTPPTCSALYVSHRIMPLIREKRVFILSCQLLLKLSKANLLTAHKLKAAHALALLTETEDFSTHTAQYYSADDCSVVLIELRDGLLNDLMKDFSNRSVSSGDT